MIARGAQWVLESPSLQARNAWADGYQSLRQHSIRALKARYSSHLKGLLEKNLRQQSLLKDFASAICSRQLAQKTPIPAKETELFI